jgi:hypothetical protein
MSKFLPAVFLIALFSCHSSVPKFIPKIDSFMISYTDKTFGPAIFVGLDSTFQSFVRVSPSSNEGMDITDSAWIIKQRIDTLTGPKAHHTYRYIPVAKRYVTIVPGDPTKY